MNTFLYVIKRILTFPLDLIAAIFGGIPPSYYDQVKRESEHDAARFETNEEYCMRKYGMTMLEKLRLEERKIKGEEEFRKIQEDCVKYQDPWCHLDVIHDMFCSVDDSFDFMLEEIINLWKYEAEQKKLITSSEK